MKVLCTPFKLCVIFAGSLGLTFFSGCVTGGKPAPTVATSRPAEIPPIAKVETVSPPASVPVPAAAPIAPAPMPIPPAVSTPEPVPAKSEPVVAAKIPTSAGHAKIRGSQESSMLLDNFTAFVVSIDGNKIAAGRNGWDTPAQMATGPHTLEVEFNRGVFVARATLKLEAKADADYELRYKTDAQLFGHNSYCNFWIVDRRTDQTVTTIEKASVGKITVAGSDSTRP